jgi:hypothetical protein
MAPGRKVRSELQTQTVWMVKDNSIKKYQEWPKNQGFIKVLTILTGGSAQPTWPGGVVTLIT